MFQVLLDGGKISDILQQVGRRVDKKAARSDGNISNFLTAQPCAAVFIAQCSDILFFV